MRSLLVEKTLSRFFPHLPCISQTLHSDSFDSSQILIITYIPKAYDKTHCTIKCNFLQHMLTLVNQKGKNSFLEKQSTSSCLNSPQAPLKVENSLDVVSTTNRECFWRVGFEKVCKFHGNVRGPFVLEEMTWPKEMAKSRRNSKYFA